MRPLKLGKPPKHRQALVARTAFDNVKAMAVTKQVSHLRWSQAPPLPWRRPGSADIHVYMRSFENASVSHKDQKYWYCKQHPSKLGFPARLCGQLQTILQCCPFPTALQGQ